MTPKFQHVIAFGTTCETASGLSRLGLRENSGPFDWIFCKVELGLTLMENHFDDFLNPDNMVHRPHPLNNGEYYDKKYEIMFLHDFNPAQDAPPLSEQIAGVQKKYQRRIDFLYECLKEPCLFVHGCHGNEAALLNDKIDEVRARLRAFHPGNDIIFFSNCTDPKDCPNLPLYKVGTHKSDHVLGLCYDDNKELHDFLTSPETYPVEKRARSLEFFIKKQIASEEDLSANETRIAKERLEHEAVYWQQWVRLQLSGKKITDRLIADGIKKVGLFGANEFTRLLIPLLQESGITPAFVTDFHLNLEEYCGVEVRHPVRKPMPPEEQKKFDEENARRVKEGLLPLKPPRKSFLLAIPGIEEIDACIAAEVEMAYFMTTRPDQKFPFRIYTLTDLTR